MFQVTSQRTFLEHFLYEQRKANKNRKMGNEGKDQKENERTEQKGK